MQNQARDTADGLLKPTAFITALLEQLATISSASGKGAAHPAQLPPEARTILLTLHVLFPHTLLDALDLLDRGLVIKLIYAPASAPIDITSGTRGTQAQSVLADAGIGRDEEQRGLGDVQSPEVSASSSSHVQVHEQVRWHVMSSQSLPSEDRSRWHSRNREQQSRSYDSSRRTSSHYDSYDGREESSGSIGGGTSYAVHLKAWNCSCPAFAFAAVATTKSTMPQVSTRAQRGESGEHDPHDDRAGAATSVNHREIEDVWYRHLLSGSEAYLRQGTARTTTALPFGGLTDISSQSARETVPPTCKHLLACLLAEKCPAFFVPTTIEKDNGVGNAELQYATRHLGPGLPGAEGKKGVVVKNTDDIHELAAWAAGVVGA